MKCPRCSTDLHMGERNGVEIDYCMSCRGIWLDSGELEKIIQRSGKHHGNPTYQQQTTQQTYQNQPQQRKKKEDKDSWLENVFDIFDF